MIKTLFASVCVLACCIGNEYPAKADYFKTMEEHFEREEARKESDYQRSQIQQLRRDVERLQMDIDSERNGFSL